jgi:hypothetical protein
MFIQSGVLLAIIFGCFCLLSLASVLNPGIYLSLSKGNIKTNGIKTFVKETMPAIKLSGIILLLNFIISSSIFGYLATQSEYNSYVGDFPFIFLAPIILFLWELVCMLMVGILIGETWRFHEPVLIRLMGAQIMGVIFWACILGYYIYPEYDGFILLGGIIAIGAETILRLFRTILNVYPSTRAWYYLILYFCTLEILPLFVIIYLLM